MVGCGFDELMRSGVAMFASGMAYSIKHKAKERDVTLAVQMEQERTKLRILEEECRKRIAEKEKRGGDETVLRENAFLGLVLVARHFVEHRCATNKGNFDREVNFHADAHDLGTLIEQFEAHYEQLPADDDHRTKVAQSLVLTLETSTGNTT